MNFLPVGNKADHIRLTIKNEDTVSIPQGTPVSLMLNGTDDGLAIALPSTNGATKAQSAFLGVTLATHAVNDVGTVISFGIVPYALLTVMTRGASSNSWSSSASVAVGELLAIDTINNAFLLESASLGSNNFLPFAILAGSISSYAASASATSDTRTAIVVGVRVFVRAL
jgi:hypothetical protein